MKLPVTKQCSKCPWKVSTDPHSIPNGYDPERHADLSRTIAEPGDCSTGSAVRHMACHESPKGKEYDCLGWLMHQLGLGNNIGLRMRMSKCENIQDVELDGDQHARFEDTLP